MFLKLHIPDVAPHGAEYGIRKNKHLFQIIKDIACKLLHIVLIGIGTGVLIPFIGCKAVGDASAMMCIGIELYKTGISVVAHVAPCG